MESLLYYTLGSFSGIFLKDIIKSKAKKNVIYFSLIIICISQIFLYVATYYNFPQLKICFCIFLVAGVWIFSDLFTFANIKFWMKFSFFIYASHIFFLNITRNLFYNYLPHNSLFALSDYIFTSFFAILIAALVALFLKSKANPVWKLLSGGR